MELKRYSKTIILIFFGAFISMVMPLAKAHGPIPIPLEVVTKQLAAQSPPSKWYSSDDVAAFPPVEKDIQAILQNTKSRDLAISRLIARGEEAVPAIRKVITEQSTNSQAKRILIIVLGRIKVPGTQKDIIAATEQLRQTDSSRTNRTLYFIYGNTFKLLGKFDDLQPAIAYADKLLADPDYEPVVHARALAFLADNRIQSGAKWFEQYHSPDNDLSVRYAVLYLGGMLSIEASKPAIIDILENRPDKGKAHFGEEELLLRGLINLTTPDEYRQIMEQVFNQQNFFPHEEKSRLLELSKLYAGNQEQRAGAALVFLKKWGNDPRACKESINYMISIGDAAPYQLYWRLSHPVLRHYVYQAGYTIENTRNKAVFKPYPGLNVPPITKPDSLAKTIVAALKTGDLELYKDQLVSRELFELINSDKNHKLSFEAMSNKYVEHKQRLVDDWQHVRKVAASKGLKLQNVKYQSAEYQILVLLDGMQMAEIKINLEMDNKHYQLQLDSSVLYDDKWQAISGLRWQRF